ncbi:MAG: hypothetical protein MMC23_001415 [Stictis urceolatum]|nr:hypothetical protein [Stictis urceolata]
MPYNTAAIVPSEETTGTAVLPLARVKKTLNADEDIGNVSAQAAFIICKATELFVQYAVEKAHEIARAEAKPKRSLTYTHFANAVARTDNLEFLSDIAPQTTTWRAHKDSRAAQSSLNPRKPRASGSLDPRQTTLGGSLVGGGPSGGGFGESSGATPIREGPSVGMGGEDREVEEQRRDIVSVAMGLVNGSGSRSGPREEVNGDGRRDGEGDVDMD